MHDFSFISHFSPKYNNFSLIREPFLKYVLCSREFSGFGLQDGYDPSEHQSENMLALDFFSF